MIKTQVNHFMTSLENGVIEDWAVSCDNCNATAPKGANPSKALEQATLLGFKTIFTKPTAQAKHLCKKCQP